MITFGSSVTSFTMNVSCGFGPGTAAASTAGRRDLCPAPCLRVNTSFGAATVRERCLRNAFRFWERLPRLPARAHRLGMRPHFGNTDLQASSPNAPPPAPGPPLPPPPRHTPTPRRHHACRPPANSANTRGPHRRVMRRFHRLLVSFFEQPQTLSQAADQHLAARTLRDVPLHFRRLCRRSRRPRRTELLSLPSPCSSYPPPEVPFHEVPYLDARLRDLRPHRGFARPKQPRHLFGG